MVKKQKETDKQLNQLAKSNGEMAQTTKSCENGLKIQLAT